jgi:hypothetical protein
MPSAEECFAAQEGPLTCVAACVVMIRRWRGEATDEAAVLADWGAPPFALPIHAADDGYFASLDPDQPIDLELLRNRASNGWVIVTVMFVPRRPAHAIVLVGLVGVEGFLYLDPAEPRREQPFEISATNLVKVWTGHTLVAKR